MADAQSVDQLFISKLTGIVITNLSKEDFDVEELASTAGISRSSM